MAELRKLLMWGAPMMAVATVALGLRVGAGDAVRGAVVHAAPRGSSPTFAWQVETFLEDRGVREAVAVSGLVVTTRAPDGATATWRGESNGDGVAEIRLDLPSVKEGDRLTVSVRSDGSATPLAEGVVTFARPTDGSRPSFESSDAPGHGEGPTDVPPTFVRATRRDGDVALDIAVYGERLTPGSSTPLWVRATDRVTGRALGGVVIDAEPEPGLELASTKATTCTAGYAQLSAAAVVHTVGLSLHARAEDGKRGEYFSGLPVAAGAYTVTVPMRLPPNVVTTFDIGAPAARKIVYAEIDDAQGRLFAAALPLSTDGTPHAAFGVPPMSPGLHWLITSGDPKGAEAISGATVARPFWVGPQRTEDACATSANLAAKHAEGFRRWALLDGFEGLHAAYEARRARGLLIAFVSLAIAAALEMLLIFTGARRAAADLARAAEQLGPDAAPRAFCGRHAGAASLAIGLLLALLGFALLASLLAYR